MAGKSAVVSVLITGDAKDLTKAFGDGEKAAGGFGGKLGGTKAALLGVAGAAVAGGAVLFSWAQGAAEDEKAATALAKTAQNLTGATKEQTDALEDYITQQGKSFGVADDQLRPALDVLIRGTGDLTEAQKLSNLAMDISAGTGKDLTAVSEALSKAYNGQLGPLKKLDPALGDLIKSGASTDEVMKALSETFAGQAAASADTAAGKMAIAKLQFSEMQEQIGYKLIPVLAALATWLVEDVIPAIEATAHWIEYDLIPVIQAIARWINDYVVPVIRVLIGIIGEWIEWNIKVATAIVNIGVEIVEIGRKLWQFGYDVYTVGGNIVNFITGMPGKIKAAASGMWDGIKDAFKEAINWIIGKWNGLEFKLPEVDTHIPGIGKVGGFTLGTPDIPYLAAGGTARGAGWSVVGDAGPELLHMPRGASVVPLGAGGGTPIQFINYGTIVGPERWLEDSLAKLKRQGSPVLASGFGA